MKIKLSIGLVFLIVFLACSDKKGENTTPVKEPSQNKIENLTAFEKVLQAHGEKTIWKSQKSFSFTTEIPLENSQYQIALPERKMRIASTNFNAAHDGSNLWTQAENNQVDMNVFKRGYDRAYYLAAAPFSFIQEGAFYTQRLDEVLLRKTYGVIHIGFGRGSGKSSDDEYVIYFDKETHQIVWLGYTVVEQGRYKRKYWEFLNYTHFQDIEGLKLPEKGTLHKAEGDQPIKVLRTLNFSQMKLSEAPLEASTFEAPEGSEFR